MRRRCPVCLGHWLLVLAVTCVSAGALAQDPSPQATKAYNTAVGVHNGEDYELASTLWKKFIADHATDPRVPDAWHYQGICHSKLGKLDEAVGCFEKVVSDSPGFARIADTYLNLGLTQYNIAHGGKPDVYDKAAETFGTLATKFPEGKHVADAVFYHGECLYNRGKKQEAAAKYNEVVTKYPDKAVTPQALFALGVTRTDLGQHQEAIASYADFLQKFPENPLVSEATMWRGESQYALKQHAEAAKSYAAAVADQKFRMADYATVRQADALAALKQFAEAAALYASVPEKFKTSQYVDLCNLEAGKKYYAAGDFPNAQVYLGKVVDQGGKSTPKAGHWLARSLLKQNKAAEALAVVEKALPLAGEGPDQVSLLMDQADATYEIPARRGESVALYAALAEKYPNDPSVPQALYMAAFAAMNQGDYQAALIHADAFLAAHEGQALAVGVMHVKAESLLLLKKYAEAEKLYGELLEKAPDDRDAEIWKVHLGTAMYLQKKYQETVAALEPVIDQIKTPELLAEAWYRIGRSQAGMQQFDAAVKSLESSLSAAANWKLADDARLVLAYAYQQTNQFDKAKEHAQEVITDNPDSKLLDMAHYRLAECCRLTRDLKAAVAGYEKILKDWPNTSVLRQTLYGLGWAQVELQDFAAAETAFTGLIDKFAGDKLVPRAQYGRGMARRQLKKYAPAAEDIGAFLATEPAQAQKSRARHVLGLCQRGLKQFKEAVATFEGLLKDDPGYDDKANVYFELGWALKSDKQDARAAETFKKLTDEFPDHALAADSHYLVGDHAYDQKSYQDAARGYHAAMTRAGKTKLGEEASYKLGLSYYCLKKYDEAQKTFAYQQATWPQGPLCSDGAFMEGECFFKQQQYEEARAAYQKVVKPSTKEIEVLALLHAAVSAGKQDDWKTGLELATKCMTQFPDSPHFPQALYEKGHAQDKLGMSDEAMATYQEVIGKTNLEPAARAQFMIGQMQFRQNKHSEAIVSFITCATNYGYPALQADSLWEAGRCYEVLKKVPQAVIQYQKLVQKFPDSDKVPLAKERIAELKP